MGVGKTAINEATDADRAATGLAASFTWHGRTLSVAAPHRQYVARIGRFIGLPLGSLPGAEHFAIAGGAPGQLTWSWRSSGGIARSPDDAVASLLTMMCFQFLVIDGYYALHAGGIVVDGKARLLLGPGHIGKSTLTAEAWLAGYEILGDDYLVLDSVTGQIEAVPKPLKLRLKTPALPERLKPVLAEDDYCIGFVDDLPVVKLARSLPRMAPLGRAYEVEAIYVLLRSTTSITAMRPATKYEALQALLEQTFVNRLPGLGILDYAAPLIRGGRVLMLTAGDGDQAGALAAMTAPL
jgi:hypothetical protein